VQPLPFNIHRTELAFHVGELGGENGFGLVVQLVG
jgi:hypothetical protein